MTLWQTGDVLGPTNLNAKAGLLPTSTLNAATFLVGSSRESQIQAAINSAVTTPARYVWIPASLLPYSAASVSFSTAVRMLREGGPTEMLDIIAYGADPSNTSDSAAAIQAAINYAIAGSAVTNTGVTPYYTAVGGNDMTVYVPPGKYKVGSTLSVAVNGNQLGVALRMVGGGYSEQNQGGVSGEPGPGWGAQLSYTSTAGDLLFLQCGAGAGNSRIRFLCENLAFVGNKNVVGATGGGGLHFQSQLVTADIHSVLRHVYVMRAKDNGIWLEGTNNVQWFNVQSNENGLRGLYSTGTGSASIVWSPESHFYALECSLNSSHGMELTSGVGNTAWFGYTANVNTGKALLIPAGCNNQRFYNIEAEVNGTSPVIDIASNNFTAFGTQIVYSNSTQIGVSLAGFECVIHGLNANSAAGQKDIQFVTANSHHNIVEGWISGDLLADTSHISSDPVSYQNIVRHGPAAVTAGFFAPDGTSAAPSLGFGGEVAASGVPGLGFYRSGASTIAQSYGTFAASLYSSTAGGSAVDFRVRNSNAMRAGTAGSTYFLDLGTVTVRDGDGNNAAGTVQVGNGSAGVPSFGFAQEAALGFWRSAASTVALASGGLGIKAGTNASCGTAVMSTGSVHVSTNYVKTGDLIFLTDQTPGGTLGDLEINGITNASGFTIQSTSATDTSTVAWLIVRPT